MDSKDKQIKELQHTIENLNHQIENLTEIIKVMQKQKFGSSSEQTEITDEQLCLFNEAELYLNKSPDVPEEPFKDDIKGIKISKNRVSRKIITDGLPLEEVICDVPKEQLKCNKCGSKLVKIGKETVREEIEYIPAQIKLIRYVRMTYGCPECKKTDNPYMIKARVPISLLNHSLASPSSVAWAMYQKYVNAMPLYRQEKDWENSGIKLSRTTLANWIIKCSEIYLNPVNDYLKTRFLESKSIHVDETPIQVLKEEGRKLSTKSYMWVYRSGKYEDNQIVLYDYNPARNGDLPQKFLNTFSGYMHTDGYAGYNKVVGVTRCGCWAHVRRYFVEAMPSNPSRITEAQKGRDYCDALFRIEDKLKDLSIEKRKEEREKLERPILEQFWEFIDNSRPLKGSKLAKAVNYAIGQKTNLENYLLDGRCNISNNIAENCIRPFTVGRKNWLFSDTPAGAKASATVYSIVETAKANNLNVYDYLKFLLDKMCQHNFLEQPEIIEKLMPWTEYAKANCRALADK